MPIDRRDPLSLRDEPCERLTLKLPRSTHLALYHYCLMQGANAAKVPLAVARIVDVFLSRDGAFKRWRATQGETLPTDVPRPSSRPRAEHA